MQCPKVHTALCTSEITRVAEAMQDADEGQGVVIACAQERARFEEIAADLSAPMPVCVDLRDRAGWSDDPSPAKMAALLAEAQLPHPAMRSMDVESHGQCLIIGAGADAFDIAAQLSDALAVTVLQTDAEDMPLDRRFEVIRGQVKSLSGALGGFALRIDALQQVDPVGRGAFGLTPPRDGARTMCDVVVDVTGATALVPAPHKRDGYFRADPRDPRAIVQIVADASQTVGVFEKPLYLAVDDTLCAHSRAGQSGCSRCVDVCPTGAIRPDGDHVTVDPMICAGCGACSALCPSGAIAYDAPPVATTFQRIELLARTYRDAGGQGGRLLVHDDHGAEMISLAARFGRGLPGAVIPLHVASLPLIGHAELLAAIATGMSAVDILLSPGSDRDTLARECDLARAMGAAGRIDLLDIADPEALSDHLYGLTSPAPVATPILPMGGRRQVARLAGKTLTSDVCALPDGAPYGTVEVTTDACTLCLSCVSLCPSGALLDNPDMPQLRFQEDACLQCGICANTCPENAISLTPRFNPGDDALAQRVLHEEEPYCCIECGAAFGVKSTVERVYNALAGKHPMFADGPAGRLIRMCDNCRIDAQYHSDNSPMAQGTRPRPVTTDDYLSKRRDH